jgi:hypothetical protein
MIKLLFLLTTLTTAAYPNNGWEASDFQTSFDPYSVESDANWPDLPDIKALPNKPTG